MRIKRTFAARLVTDPVEALRRVVYGSVALDACAESVGVSHQTLSKQLNEEDGNCPSLRRAAAIELFMDTDALAECFAARRGGIFLKLPALDRARQPEDLVNGWANFITEFADASRAFSEAVADNRITAAEVDKFHKELRDLTAAGEQLVMTARARVEEPKS